MIGNGILKDCLAALVITAGVVRIALGTQLVQAEHSGDGRAEDVLSKYPSPGQIEASIRELRLTDRASVEQIRADFDLAESGDAIPISQARGLNADVWACVLTQAVAVLDPGALRDWVETT